RTLPPQCGSEQRGQQLDRRCFVGSSKRLEPYRPQPDLTVINCRRAQRQQLAAAMRHVGI
ncbi:MAG: hypothetical protein ACREOQ_00510, partial [Gemmatimonadales bacterium]